MINLQSKQKIYIKELNYNFFYINKNFKSNLIEQTLRKNKKFFGGKKYESKKQNQTNSFNHCHSYDDDEPIYC